MVKLLVIDDEPGIRHAFRRAFSGNHIDVRMAATAEEGLQIVGADPPDVVLLDVNLPDLCGLEAIRRIQQIDARIPVIVITGQGTTDTAIKAIKLGAFEYVLKPLELEGMRQLIQRAAGISRRMRTPAVLPGEPADQARAGADLIIGQCPAMQEVYKTIGRVAPTDVTVLILGESGTGKELVARAIYQHSRRANGPFLAVNSAAIPESLVESELFGHERGAFTDAERQRIGKFEQCAGGTLFLDEIADMSSTTQAKILRVLQEKRFERVGGSQTVTADVRVIAATHRDLPRLIAENRFRGDLYYRLGVVTIDLPPLRMRGDDLQLLAEHFLRGYSLELNRPTRQIAPEAYELMRRYSWPGNIRELQSVLKQSLLRATGPVLLPEFLPPGLQAPAAGTAAIGGEARGSPPDFDVFIDERLAADTSDLYAQWIDAYEPHLLERVFRHAGGNISQAARILGINRRTLRLKLHNLGLATPESD